MLYIYGVLSYRSSLTNICQVIAQNFELNSSQVWVYRSQYDGAESLKIRTNIFNLETQQSKIDSKHLISGEITGDRQKAIDRVQILADLLILNQCSALLKYTTTINPY